MTPSFAINFNLLSGRIEITDTFDYAGAGIAPADVNGAIWITAPSGTQIKTGSHVPGDILPAVSTTNSTTAIPTDVTGAYQVGNYTVRYEIDVVGAVNPGTYNASATVSFCNELPTAGFTWESNCLCEPILTLTDSTSYTGWTVVSKSLTLSPPPNAPVNTPLNTTVSNSVDTGSTDVYTGTWSGALSTAVTRTYTGYTVSGTVTGNSTTPGSTFDLVCQSLCRVRCCLAAEFNRLQEAQAKGNKTLISYYWDRLNRAMTLATLIQFSESCGVSSTINTYIEEIQSILGCSDDCGDCGETSNGLIVPVCTGGGGSSYTAGTKITIVGGVISVSTQASQKIDALYNAVVAAGSDMTVTPVTTPGNPDIVTYTVAFSGTIPSVMPIWAAIVRLEFGSFTPTFPTVSTPNKSLQETVLANSPTFTPFGGGVLANYASVTVSNMYSGVSNDKFRLMAKVNNIALRPPFDTFPQISLGSPATVEIYDRDETADTIEFRFVNPNTGSPWSWTDLAAILTSIDLHVIITA